MDLIKALQENEKRIPLTKGQFAIVDAEDYDRLMEHKWHAVKPSTVWYAVRIAYDGKRRKRIRMHRDIMNAPDDKQVDHINRNGLYNVKNNLRLCTASQNEHNKGINKTNTSGFKGVSWSRQNKRWRVTITDLGKSVHLGYFFCIIKAAAAYDRVAKELFGEFAYTNFKEKSC